MERKSDTYIQDRHDATCGAKRELTEGGLTTFSPHEQTILTCRDQRVAGGWKGRPIIEALNSQLSMASTCSTLYCKSVGMAMELEQRLPSNRHDG